MTLFFVVLAAIVAAFVLGKVYGARVEAKAIAEYVKVRASFTTETGKAYAALVADIKTTVSKGLARIRKAL
jgi:hypothetical protein